MMWARVDRSPAFLSQKSGKEMYNSCMGKFGKAQVSRCSALCSGHPGHPGHPAGRLPPARAAVTPSPLRPWLRLVLPPPPPPQVSDVMSAVTARAPASPCPLHSGAATCLAASPPAPPSPRSGV